MNVWDFEKWWLIILTQAYTQNIYHNIFAKFCELHVQLKILRKVDKKCKTFWHNKS